MARLAANVEFAAARTVRSALYIALFIVPLLVTSPDAMFGYADVPKIAAVRVLAGVIAAAWAAHAAAGVVRTGTRPKIPAVFGHRRWIGASAGLFLLVAFASALFAVSRKTAFAGAYPGYDSTDLYSLAAYVLIGAAAARFLLNRRHIERALWSVALAGGLASVYGIAQSAGLDPFHFDRFEVNDGRSPLTFGNPAFAGSFLTMSLPVTVGLFLLQQRPFSRAGLLAFAAILLQLAALGTSASRGAWVGTGTGAVLFAVLIIFSFRREQVAASRRHLAMVGIVVLAAVAAGGALLLADSGSNNAADRLQSLNGDLLGSGLNGRGATWSSTLEMIGERPPVETQNEDEASIAFPWVRHLFGYGPDNYRYAYQLVAPDEHVASFVPHAHNSFLNVAAELGIAGLAAWTALSVAVVAAGVMLARDRAASSWVRLLAVGVTSAFAAHAVDQLANLPRASDSLVMWMLIGVMMALVAVRRRGAEEAVAFPPSLPGRELDGGSFVHGNQLDLSSRNDPRSGPHPNPLPQAGEGIGDHVNRANSIQNGNPSARTPDIPLSLTRARKRAPDGGERGQERGGSSSGLLHTQRQIPVGTMSGAALIAPALAVVAIAVIAVLSVVGNAGHLLADRAAASLQSDLLRGVLVADLADSSDRAARLAGDVGYYHSLEASALQTAAEVAGVSASLQSRLFERSLAARESAVNAIPLSPAENFSYARALSESGRAQEALERYELGVRLSPRYWAAWLGLARAHALAGSPEVGVVALRRAEELIGRQALSTRQHPDNVRQFDTVRMALGIESG